MTLVAALGQQHQNCEKQRDPQHLLRLEARLASGEQQRQHSHERLTEKMQIGAAAGEHLSALVAVAAGRRQHKNSTASSTTDQCSSLNLSSLASSSSASSSVQHSPLMTGGGAGGVGAASNNCNSNANSNACPQRASGRNSSASQTSSLLGASPLAPETLEGSGDDDDDEQILHEQLCDPSARALRPGSATKLFAPQHQQQQCQARLSSGDLAAASNRLQAGSGVKARSLSHSNTFSPSLQAVAAATATPPASIDAAAAATTIKTTTTLASARLSSTASSPGDSSGRQSAASSAASASNQQEEEAEAANAQGELQARLHATAEAARPRRLSRIEHRLSLLELGYGKIESYFKLQRLGKGTYATVYMGRSRLSNDLVALKEILKEHDEGAPCTAIREVSLLRVLRHNNIVTLHDICHTPRKLTLVFEYVGPDLYAYMKENNNLLSIHNVRLLLYQLLRGIAFCHSRQVLHRDLKPQNLLINARGELKICDFGLARAKSIPTKSYSNEVVTLWYRPPDVLLGNTDYDHSIDMWGVGCIFYEMASGRTFFPGSSVRQQLYLIFSSLGAPSRHNWPEILQNPEYQAYSFPSFRPEKLAHRVPRLDSAGILLLMSFLRFKPSERISADEARRDPFFAALPERVHKLSERESIFDVPGVYMTLNPGQKMGHHI